MIYVTAYFIDAADGCLSSMAPLRHGPALPQSELIVDAVDHRQTPASIIGRLPAGAVLEQGVIEITPERHAELMTDYQQWREAMAMKRKLLETESVEQARREAYRERVDPLVSESVLKRSQGLTSEADELLAAAIVQRQTIQGELPWPA